MGFVFTPSRSLIRHRKTTNEYREYRNDESKFIKNVISEIRQQIVKQALGRRIHRTINQQYMTINKIRQNIILCGYDPNLDGISASNLKKQFDTAKRKLKKYSTEQLHLYFVIRVCDRLLYDKTIGRKLFQNLKTFRMPNISNFRKTFELKAGKLDNTYMTDLLDDLYLNLVVIKHGQKGVLSQEDSSESIHCKTAETFFHTLYDVFNTSHTQIVSPASSSMSSYLSSSSLTVSGSSSSDQSISSASSSFEFSSSDSD